MDTRVAYGIYTAVAASQTAAAVGPATAGSYLLGVLVVPALISCGSVTITDGNGSAITIFVGGVTTNLPSCIPFFVPVGARAVNTTTPGWKVTTGASVSVIAITQ